MSRAAPPATSSAAIVAAAAERFPGGVNSPVRAFGATGRPPVVLVAGEGPHVIDADGRRYVDLISSWGATILGHAHPAITRAVAEAARSGMALGATHPLEVALADAIAAAMPGLERMRFVSSGTEAVMSAIRVARAATGRELVVKTEGAYHGHADGLLVQAGSGLATLALPGSAGVPAAVASGTIVVPFNDAAAIERALVEHADRVAAVILEPVVANAGVIPPAGGYLAAVRASTRAAGSLLVLDEVITGFRLAHGGAQARYGVEPDLTTLGKVIGGGMPIGAYGGRRELMELVAPVGPVYQAGTLAGHPLAMAAGVAALGELDAGAYRDLEASAERLAGGLETIIARHGARAAISRAGPLLTLFFLDRPPRDAAAAMASDRAAWSAFFGRMLDAGVLLPPSPFEAWFPGLAHGPAEIDAILEAADGALAEAERDASPANGTAGT